MVEINHEFTVDRSPDAVWTFFQDIPEVASCMPGAELEDQKEGDTYEGKVSVKLGAMTATFEGQATIDPDPETHTCHISGKGVDRRGGSRGQVDVDYRLHGVNGGTRVEVDADVKLSGAAAQFGRKGLITEMSNRLIGEFVDCLEAKLGAESPEQAREIRAGEVKGISLFFASLWSSIKEFFRRTFGSGGGSKDHQDTGR